MKVSCLQDNLNRGLVTVGRAVAPKGPLPVLGNVLLATDKSGLKLAATNLEIGITCWTGCQIETEGAITVPARLLSEFVSSLPPERIELTADMRTQTLNLRCGRYEANIKGIDAEEFPPIPQVSDQVTARLEPERFRQMISQVVFAAATDETRPVLAGVLANFEGQRLTLAAADGFRLAVRAIELDEPVGEPISIIIPARALNELGRIIAEDKEPVEITVTPSRNQVLFHADNVDLVSRLVEGNFPNYQQIIPQAFKTRTVVETAEFLKATRIASYFARDSANIVKLSIVPGGDLTPGRVVVSANAAEIGDNVGELDGTVDGEGGQIAFNSKYLTDVLSVMTTDRVALETQSPSSPGVIRPVGLDEYTHVIMPMHISSR
jgi:DNA polymerase III subunit beta